MFMAEIVPDDNVEASVDAKAKVDVELEKENEAEKVKVDQTTEAEEENLKSDDEKDAEEKDDEYKKMAAEFAALMANLDKPTGVVSSNSVNSFCLRCPKLQGEVDSLSTLNQSLINEMLSIKETNFFCKKK
ncbi:hypothetical protein Hanom_Chr08g00736351 [Helianthus anomalus]